MGRQDARDLGVSNVDVWMMIAGVSCFRDAIHESDAVGERCEGICLRKRVTSTGPAGKSAERALDFEIGELGAHGAEERGN